MVFLCQICFFLFFLDEKAIASLAVKMQHFSRPDARCTVALNSTELIEFTPLIELRLLASALVGISVTFFHSAPFLVGLTKVD